MAATSTPKQTSRALVVQTVVISLFLAGASALLWSCRNEIGGGRSNTAQAEDDEAAP